MAPVVKNVSHNGKDATTVTVNPSRFGGSVTVPSSKSHTIRALLVASCAGGVSNIGNALDSADARSCISAIRALGASVEETARTETGITLAVTPPAGGIHRAGSPGEAIRLDVGNSGTTLYLLSAIAALRGDSVTFDGDSSIRSRSAAPLLRALAAMGVAVSGGPAAPFTVAGPVGGGHTVELESPVSQYLSALLLAAPLIAASPIPAPRATPPATVLIPTVLHERPYVDMTCWWLERQKIRYSREGYTRFVVESGQEYQPVHATLPGDYSSATFWFVAAAITGGSVTVEGLAPDDVQGDRAVLNILEQMGATVQWLPGPDRSPAVTVAGPLTAGGTFDLNAIPDALPALAAAGCFAPGPVSLINVPQARSKETDRIAVMASELGKLGGDLEELPHGLVIRPAQLHGGTVNSHGDHRVAMAAAVAALAATEAVTIVDAGAAAVTYPSFFAELQRLAPGAGTMPERAR